ncbi:hypothetical protein O0235_02445 [Tepidiforma flava]|uniref:DUF2188 domain-containing protein n=1 Tax=Tepidiforma flava TaxID=3004094 RepID=A0ABY7M8G8_9CHLR|nr:hypothetical protein [Tepidiforma flava]WBL36447.1 hypothetical protein O0235_02445 [Tepidiforma flava]
MEEARGTPARELHLVPAREGWLLVAAGTERPVGVYRELGAAIDAATAGARAVRLVVHERRVW